MDLKKIKNIIIAFINDNLIEIFLLIGMVLISVGFFIWSTIIGFVVSGLLFISLSYITFRFKGGE